MFLNRPIIVGLPCRDNHQRSLIRCAARRDYCVSPEETQLLVTAHLSESESARKIGMS